MITDSKLTVYPTGIFVEDNMNPGSWVPECSITMNIETMNDPRIAEHIRRVRYLYGFTPKVRMSDKLKIN